MTGVPIDQQARVALAHAAVDALARQAGCDVLHVKGPALHETLRHPGRASSDADVLVRPAHVRRLTDALSGHGWRLVTGFASGSAFQHAANYHHEHWGYVDVHRLFPGVGLPPTDAFERLWHGRGDAEVAHRVCAVPAELDQALLLVLHAGRAQGDPRAAADLDVAWHAADDRRREALRARATELHAGVALAAALGELSPDEADRTADLWRFYSEGGTRLDEWRARVRAAPTRRAAVRTAVRGLGVNREFAGMQLGHDPSRSELVRLFLDRWAAALRLLVRPLLRRRR